MRFFLKTSKYLSLSIIFLLVALPYAVKFGAIYYLENEKNIKANISDISINFFTGKIGLEGVHLYGNNSGELHLGKLFLDISTTALFKKNILIESIVFHNFSSNITEQKNGWNVGGIFIPIELNNEQKKEEDEANNESNKKIPFGIGIQSIDFSSIKVIVSSQYTDSSFEINTLKANNLMSWQPTTSSPIEINVTINEKAFNIHGETKPFLNEPSFKAKVEIDNIQVSPFLKSVKDLPFDDIQVSIFSDFEFELIKEKAGLTININGNYGLKDIYLKESTPQNSLQKNNVREIQLADFIWQGKHNIFLPTNNKMEKRLNVDGILSMHNINIHDPENNVHITQEKVAITGKYNILLNNNENIPNIKATMFLALKKLTINTLDNKIKIASFDAWETEKIKIDNINDISIEQSKLSSVEILKANREADMSPATIQLKTLNIKNIEYKPEAIKINKIELSQLNIDAILDEKGEPLYISEATLNKQAKPNTTLPKASDEKLSDKEKTTLQSTKKPIRITLNEFVLDKNSQIKFTDNSVVPTFSTTLHDLSVSVKNIDTHNKKSLTDINLDMKIDEYGEFNTKGNTQLFSEKVNADLVTKLNGLELVPLSSYASKFAGINIKRGTLNVDANIKIKNDILDVNNTFHLNKLIIESNDNEVSNNIFKDMPMPLNLTLDVLRDKNNIIKLDIPVKGDVNNPDFSLQDIYNTAMVKAMKFAATHYLTQAIQPLGLIITAGKLIGKAAAPTFDPLIYDVGVSTISNKNKKIIKKLAIILQEKNKLKFTICGIATESDWKYIQNKRIQNKDKKVEDEIPLTKKELENKRRKTLLKLANNRTKKVKKYFVEEFNIKPSRLFTCNGKIYKDKKNKPAIPTIKIGL